MAKVGEKGGLIRIGTSFDMSSQTSLSLKFYKPDGTTATVTPTLETSQVVTTAGTFAANESVKYTFITGDLDQADSASLTWQAQVTYNNSGGGPDLFISDRANFSVDAV